MAVTGGGRNIASEAASLVVQAVRSRWFTVFTSQLIMSMTGAAYIFAIYSKDLKSTLNYNQQTLNTLSFFKDLGVAAGTVLSPLVTHLAPPSLLLSIGATTNLVGYLMIYLSLTSRIPRPQTWQTYAYFLIAGNSQPFSATAASFTLASNFPESRRIVLGLVNGFAGLSGAVLTQIYFALYGDDRGDDHIVLLVAWLPAAVALLFACSVRVFKTPQIDPNPKPFDCFVYISLALASYLMVINIVEYKLPISRAEYGAAGAVVIFLLLLPNGVIIKEMVRLRSIRDQITSIAIESEPAAVTPPDRCEGSSILQALVSVDMMVIFITTVCGAGGTLTAIDNMGQIAQSLGYPHRSVATLVSIISVCNYFGRIAAAHAAKVRIPRPLLLTAVLLLSCAGHLLIAFGARNALYFASGVVGFCFGAQLALVFAIMSEIFGMPSSSKIYGFGSVAGPIGSFVLNVSVAGRLYDREAARQNGGVKEATCVGDRCFKLPFIIITAVTVAGALVSLVLVWRSWGFCRGKICGEFRPPAVAAAEVEGVVTEKRGDECEKRAKDEKKEGLGSKSEAF